MILEAYPQISQMNFSLSSVELTNIVLQSMATRLSAESWVLGSALMHVYFKPASVFMSVFLFSCRNENKNSNITDNTNMSLYSKSYPNLNLNILIYNVVVMIFES